MSPAAQRVVDLIELSHDIFTRLDFDPVFVLALQDLANELGGRRDVSTMTPAGAAIYLCALLARQP